MIIVKDNVSKSIVVEDKIKVDDVLQVPVNKDKKVGETVHYSFVRKDKSKNDHKAHSPVGQRQEELEIECLQTLLGTRWTESMAIKVFITKFIRNTALCQDNEVLTKPKDQKLLFKLRVSENGKTITLSVQH